MEIYILNNDVLKLIFNMCKLKDIKNIIQTCSRFQNVHDWRTYFLSYQGSNVELYNEWSIDVDFMRNHGKFLICINNQQIIRRYLKYYSTREIDTEDIFREYNSNSCTFPHITFTLSRQDYPYHIYIDVYKHHRKLAGTVDVRFGNIYVGEQFMYAWKPQLKAILLRYCINSISVDHRFTLDHVEYINHVLTVDLI